jgi:acyl-CoA synthetase (AMP-forming)/AMP-acid ligase II
MIFLGPEADPVPALQSSDVPLIAAESIWELARKVDEFPTEPPANPIDRDALAVQLYTSGTTSNPKGAMLTQYSFVRHLQNMLEADVHWNRWSRTDVSLLPMPVSHIGGTAWGIWAIFHGARTIVERQFDIQSTFDRIEYDRVSKMFVVPAALQAMVRHPRAATIDYSHVTNMNYGASPISPALLKESLDTFGCGFTQMYGMTETIGTIVALPPEDHTLPINERMKSAGRPVPGMEIAIVDADGHRLPPRVVGEVIARGPAMMKGYWRRPEETAKTIDKDGWLHTGDAGYLDEDGYLYIHDRMKDLIISGGENIYSAEVEGILSEHPAITEVVVVGIPDERWGETVLAVVVLRHGHILTDTELIAWAKERLAGFKIPRSIKFMDELPRNPSGKVLKRELRAPYWHAQFRQVS